MKKTLIGLLVFTLFSCLAPINSSLAAVDLTPGDLVKTAGNSTVYYYGYDGNRHAFPLEKVFYSWYAGFDSVRTISANDLAALPLGKSILMKPGTYLLKLVTDPKVYAVEPEGKLRYISSPSQASQLYGGSWESLIVDLPDSFYGDYQDGGALELNRHPTGTVFRWQGEPDNYYYLVNGYARKFVSSAYWHSYHFNPRFIKDLAYQNFHYRGGDSITQYQVALGDTAQTLIGAEAKTLINYAKGGSGGDGLWGTYYSGKDLTNRAFERLDGQVNFDWASGSPGSGLGSDNFSVRWEGQVNVNSDSTVTFFVQSDDGARLYLDGSLVIDSWQNYQPKVNGWHQGSVYLTSGSHDIKLEYFEVTGGAYVKLCWNKQGELIPQGNLFSR
ncbi:MAG: PA14 domain-containing protein [Patescibacteria group bacterium]|jgi:hypothetical protein